MKTKQPPAAEQARRQAILKAARKVFARKGFSGGIVDEIASEAQLAKGTIYLYFPSKRAIYTALMEQYMESLQTNMLLHIDQASTIREKIEAFILTRLENAEQNLEFFRIMDTQSENLSFTRRQHRDWYKGPVLHLAAALDISQKSKEISPSESERLAWAISDLVRGVIQRRVIGQTELTIQQETNFLLKIAMATL